MRSIDLNCDMGEGCPFDAELMKYVSSVNIACGYHAGDEQTMRRTVDLAVANGVAIGAHPGYPDRDNFGRIDMSFVESDLIHILTDQILTLRNICESAGAALSHVKPHGALYNRSARDPIVASAIAHTVKAIDPDLMLFGLAGSCSVSEAKIAGLTTASEVFADRTYRSDGSLTPRDRPNALIIDPQIAAKQALSMALNGDVFLADGSKVVVQCDTICIHGDGEDPVNAVVAIRELLLNSNISIRSLYDCRKTT
ncbi:MAG TPA: 5-oxoprolinase subunit PxpA [Pyrinomonadaceae bacterium]|nr:LamB/YcsF family protein [Chloracidobacterium sp.]MBP9936363.1 LamB/YcsF family protein [Pyrinomonadaceae bacterium]MBL0239487.1 LamB/YcsF family protein [Chloracidobacterium sp.]HQX54996.1 5-oxoprolinase subunit PxpA [Pyrinomonadaceae bacterium]HQY68383.1 5-oxoprolinase subunit PxpA [Pyrinomonadaceae bacterium]